MHLINFKRELLAFAPVANQRLATTLAATLLQQ